ncbi:MAG: acyltransferase [Phycisphaerae bacterium]|nr:acyltransferase [Phycisphaerae bacterium]
MQKDRDLSFDAFRGAAIIAVIAIHASATGFSWRHSTAGEWNFFFLITYRQLLSFAVPAFIFISGYWSSKEQIRSLRDYKTFLMKRLSRVLVPYFLWSFILLGYEAVKTYDVNVYGIVFKLLTGSACQGYFFILMIIQLYIMTPLLMYVNRKRYGLTLVLVLNIISLFVLYLSRVYNVIGRVPAALPFYSWIIFYEIGLLVGSRGEKISTSQRTRFLILPVLLVSLLVSELEGMILLLRYDNLNFAVSAIKYSSVFYSVCIIFGFLFLRKNVKYWPKSLVLMGNYSFGIYLIHFPILDRVSDIFKRCSIYSFQPLYQLAVVLMTISICFVLIGISRKLFAASFCHRILGF